MGETKKISFSVGYIEGHKKALPHVDFWVTSIDNSRKFKFQISEHLGDRGTNSFKLAELHNWLFAAIQGLLL